MKRILLSLALFLAPLPALADVTITISLSAPAGATLTKTFTPAEATKIAAYVVSLRKGSIVQTPAIAAVPAVLDGQGNVVTPAVAAVPAVMRDPTTVEALKLWFGDVMDGLAVAVTNVDRQNATTAAAAAVTPVTAK